MEAMQVKREQRERQEQQEQKREDKKQQQGESGESLPRIETASPYDRLCPCTAAARPAPGSARPLRGLRRGFEVGERLGHVFPVAALRETDENLTEIVKNDVRRV